MVNFVDGVLVVMIYGVGYTVLQRRDWVEHPGFYGYIVMCMAGFVIGTDQ